MSTVCFSVSVIFNSFNDVSKSLLSKRLLGEKGVKTETGKMPAESTRRGFKKKRHSIEL